MYLSRLTIEGYKGFRDPFEIRFSKGLNVLVGENRVGKSAVIDAIRLLLFEDEFGRNIIAPSDFHTPFAKPNKPAQSFHIRAHFSELSQEEAVAFLPWTDKDQQAFLTLQVENRLTRRDRFKWVQWGGASALVCLRRSCSMRLTASTCRLFATQRPSYVKDEVLDWPGC